MSHILRFSVGFPSFQRESRAWTIPARPGAGRLWNSTYLGSIGTGAETAEKWRCLVGRGWNRSPCKTTSWRGGPSESGSHMQLIVWKWKTHSMQRQNMPFQVCQIYIISEISEILCIKNGKTHTHTVQQWKFFIIQRWAHRFQFPTL